MVSDLPSLSSLFHYRWFRYYPFLRSFWNNWRWRFNSYYRRKGDFRINLFHKMRPYNPPFSRMVSKSFISTSGIGLQTADSSLLINTHLIFLSNLSEFDTFLSLKVKGSETVLVYPLVVKGRKEWSSPKVHCSLGRAEFLSTAGQKARREKRRL